MSQRRLALHPSALSPSEYPEYTSSLVELTGDHVENDDEYENARISVRETRGWLRGRYSSSNVNGGENAGVTVADIDTILSYFHSPTQNQTNPNQIGVLTGGEYFAILRLVQHVKNGLRPDKDLVFIQANPDGPSSITSPPPTAGSVSNPFSGGGRGIHSPTPSTSATSNLFSPPPMRSGGFSDTASLSSVSVAASAKSGPPYPLSPPGSGAILGQDLPNSPTPTPSNPFLSRSKSVSSSPFSQQQQTPPLPPRKSQKPLLPPPRHSSQSKPTAPSPLMQQSLRAAKLGRTMQEAERKLGEEKHVEVISSSKPNGARSESPSSSSRSGSGGKQSEDGSRGANLNSTTTTSSYERLAATSLPPYRPPSSTFTNNPFPTNSTITTNPFPVSSTTTTTTTDTMSPFDSPPVDSTPSLPRRPGRSKSIHDPTSPTGSDYDSSTRDMMPPPPPRRKRPESVQVFPTKSSITDRDLERPALETRRSQTFQLPLAGHTPPQTRTLSMSLSNSGSKLQRKISAFEQTISGKYRGAERWGDGGERLVPSDDDDDDAASGDLRASLEDRYHDEPESTDLHRDGMKIAVGENEGWRSLR